MDKISQPLHNYLKLAHQSALLVSQADKANLNVLLTMLGTLDKDIIDAYYGLFATPQVPITRWLPNTRLRPKLYRRLSTET